MNRPVLVTGATGNVGGATARALAAAGVPVRVAGSDPAALRQRFPAAEAARLNVLDPGTFPGALAGTGELFLLRPPPISRVGPTINAFLDPHRHPHRRPATVAGYARHLRRRGTPAMQIIVQTVLHTGLRRDQTETVDPALPRLLGREPRTMAQYIHDHRDTWIRE